MTSVVSEYLNIFYEYSKSYGDDTVVLMQVGSFYEMYGIDNDEEKVGNVQEVSRLLNVVLTKRNKRIADNSRHNPLMLGFPCLALSKYVPILLEDDYTIVVVDQVKTGDKIKRIVTNVISPSTYIDGNDDEYMVMVYIEKVSKTIHVGMSAMNAMTGKSTVHECHSAPDDVQLPLDDAASFIQQHRPREIVVASNNEELNETLISHFGLSHKVKYNFRHVNKIVSSVNYQNVVLGNVFQNDTMLSNIELLDLECRPSALISYVLLIEYVHLHNPMLVQRISVPAIHMPRDHLVLATNTIEQLNLIPMRGSSTRSRRMTSVFNVINKCKTSVGRRLLKQRLLCPIFDPAILEMRYKQIHEFGIAVAYNKPLDKLLSKMADIERLQRRMSLGIMSPNELGCMNMSYALVLELHELLLSCTSAHDCNFFALEAVMLRTEHIRQINEFLGECQSVFNMDDVCLYHDIESSKGLFREGISDKIDNLEAVIQKQIESIEKTAKEMSAHLGDPGAVRVEYLAYSGYALVTTNTRAQRLRKIKSANNFCFKMGKAATRITSSAIDAANRVVLEYTEYLRTHTKECYKRVLTDLYCTHGELFFAVTAQVSELDVVRSHYITSQSYGYCRPVVEANDVSFIDARDLRHPIIERIDMGTEYVPNDIQIGKRFNGIVLYSMNSAGKTSLLKACGISIILAQIGSFVPASSYTFYPFNALMTRILTEDNIIKGRSSFVAEMSELRGILKRADDKTLVLADEITHGTEHTSGSAIFASSVLTLADRKANFLFTTHLHNVYSFIKDTINVRVCHLSVIVHDGTVVFQRKLQDGPCDSIYGLEVCESLNMDKEFVARAFEIRTTIESDKCHDAPINMKTSRYNKNKLVQLCQVCNYSPRQHTDIPLDVHHIKQRCHSNKQGLIGSIQQHATSNLVVLCKACHIKVHSGTIKIEGYINTTKGIVLDVIGNGRGVDGSGVQGCH